MFTCNGGRPLKLFACSSLNALPSVLHRPQPPPHERGLVKLLSYHGSEDPQINRCLWRTFGRTVCLQPLPQRLLQTQHCQRPPFYHLRPQTRESRQPTLGLPSDMLGEAQRWVKWVSHFQELLNPMSLKFRETTGIELEVQRLCGFRTRGIESTKIC